MYRRLSASLMAVAAATALAACSDSEESEENVAESAPEQETPAAEEERPTAEDLNAILAKATDPAVPQEEKVNTVQGGETAPELFDTMAASKSESGAEFTVTEPVLPGFSPDSVITTVVFQLPGEPQQTADNVEFIHENGEWKLSQSWACTLVTNTVQPEQVPAMCTDGTVPSNDEAVNSEG